ncbi:hypothetical protein C2E23DRAFT_728129 [Lenzites betulinus]|nr:hypothetical protein C2E23DRAFT_728129 [Lenzites betulinus]
MATECAPDFVPLLVLTDSMYIYKGLTLHLERWENRGWIDVANKDILRRVVARLRRRSATTTLKWVKGHAGIKGNEEADKLAAEGTKLPRTQLTQLTEDDRRFLLPGAKLSALTQKLAYRGIMSWSPRRGRRRTDRNVEMIKEGMQLGLNVWPSTESLWRNVQGPDIATKVSVFFWKAMHEVHRVGSYWWNIPGYENRALCNTCEVEESLDHIIRECVAPGQRLLWDLSEETLARRGIKMPPLSTGLALGAPSLSIKDGDGNVDHGKTRLVRIVVPETMYLIWRLRCERVIGWCDTPTKVHSAAHIRRLWSTVMNERLRLDMERTKKKWGRRAIPEKKVLDTWRGTLCDEAALPE